MVGGLFTHRAVLLSDFLISGLASAAEISKLAGTSNKLPDHRHKLHIYTNDN